MNPETASMTETSEIVFYPGKRRLVHIALNVALAPLLLYLLRIWSWPPGAVHMGVFGITAILGFRFYRSRVGKPRLRFDDAGLHYKTSFPATAIRGVKAEIGALKVWVEGEQGLKEHLVNLWWASRDDMQEIVRIASERYGLMDESSAK